jgi:hypothetical protein
MIVAIHQPNFLPWLGWFDKLARADVFVILDNVALQRTGSAYTNRVEMLVSGKRSWLTVPVARGADARERIGEARIIDATPWRRKMRRTIEQSYARAPFFREIMPSLDELFDTDEDRLAAFNMAGIANLARLIGLQGRRLVRASELDVSGSGTDLLIDIVRTLGGDTYLCGGGAGGYQDDAKFAQAGLTLEYQNFRQAPYPQVSSGAFVPGLSTVDALMNCGGSGTSRLLGAGLTVARGT